MNFCHLKVKPDPSAYQLLTHLMMAVADVQSDIVEEVVLREGAELARPVVIGPGDNIPCQGTAAFTATGGKSASGANEGNVAAGGGRIVSSHARPGIGLKLPEGEAHNKVRHERSRINQIAAIGDVGAIYTEVDVGRNAVIEHVFFNGRAKRSLPEDISNFYPTIPADVTIRLERNDVAVR